MEILGGRVEHPLARLDDLGWRIPLEFGSSKGGGVDSLSFFLLTLFSQHFRLPVPDPSPALVLHKRIFRLSLTRTLPGNSMMLKSRSSARDSRSLVRTQFL
jgi:hypothetical protein